MKAALKTALAPAAAALCALLGGAAAQAAPHAAEAAAPAVLAFVSIRTGDAHIYLRDAAGGERMLTQGKGVHTQPALAATGQVAYVQQLAGKPVVMVAGADGQASRRLSASAAMQTSPSWTPDGKALAVYAMDEAGRQTLHIHDMATGTVAAFTAPGGGMGPGPVCWSADGQRLALLATDTSGKSQVFVAERNGQGLRDVSGKAAPRGAASVSLSPSGKQLLWVADMRGRMPIMLTDLDSGQTRDLTAGESAGHESPRWSPDGKHIVFVSARGGEADPRNDIYVMNADGSQVRNISRHRDEDFDPKWSADGKQLVFASLRNGTAQLFEASLVSGATRQLSTLPTHDMDHSVRPATAAP